MNNSLIHWLIPALFVLIGVLLLFVKIDPDELAKQSSTSPGLALYRFRAFRYGAAFVLMLLAVVAYIQT